MSFESINPATGEKIKSYNSQSFDEVGSVIDRVHEAFLSWRETSFGERSKLMKQMAKVLKDNKEKYAQIMTDEMGKPISQSIKEIEKCALNCEYYADNAEKFLADRPIKTEAKKSFVSFQPIGVVFAVMPWNFPYWQVFRFLCPALMAGNVGVLKHADNVTGCALAIEEIVKEAGFPENVFRTLIIDHDVSSQVIAHKHVRAVTLTGSTRAGKAVAQKAGSELKKTVLELGGSDPYVILEDADLGKAVEKCATSRLINTGQSCIAAKRFIVVESLLEEFEKKFTDMMKSKTMGDPNEEGTDLGPMARQDLRDSLHEQVTKSVEAGAKLLCGGKVPDRKGAYYPATVLTNVKKGMPAFDEELFGPVASIISVKDEDEAVKVANDNVYGLGGAVFTKDAKRGERLAREKIDVGCCFVNDFVRSDPRLPFGGVKESGYGRELSDFGIHEFVNIKTVYLA